MKDLLLKTLIIFCLCLLSGIAEAEDKILKMSTTTSTRDSGLLDVVLPVFKADTGLTIKVIAKGTGAAIRDGMDGNVDIIFVHAKAREEEFVEQGFGTKRYGVMHNDFVVIGPDKDPAKISGINNVSKALEKIAHSKSTFISRGDDSGTHTKEQEIWKSTRIQIITESKDIIKKGKTVPITFTHPEGLGEWYLSIGQGMGATITFAEEKQSYTLADRGTYLAYKFGRERGLDLFILSEGDDRLVNAYGLIPVNPKKFPHVKYEQAMVFIKWIMSEKGQKLITDYKLFGRQLFYPDAVSDFTVE